MSVCRSCRAEIIWATVRTSGKTMPLDADRQAARLTSIIGALP